MTDVRAHNPGHPAKGTIEKRCPHLILLACRFRPDDFEWISKTASERGVSSATIVREAVEYLRGAI